MTTYYARKEYIYDNGDTIFGIPFSYIKPEHIVVLINGEDTKNYTYLNTTQIRITETLNKGDKITIARTTPIDSRMVIFSNTAILDKDVQNLAQTQTFNAVQEIYDNNEVFKIETNDNLAVNKQELENIIENNKQEILGIQSGFENEVNIKIEEVSSAAEKINKLEESVNTAVTAANTASEKADSAANEAAKAKTEVDNAKAEVTKAAEQANIATSKANEATEIIGNSLANIESKTQEEINKIKQTGFYMQDDKLYYINSDGETKEFKSGSSGLEVCDIGTSLYIDETKGLRRRLNGQLVDINTNTQGFLTRLKQITTLYPSLLCTEEEWQAIKTMSKLGQCGKFVYNYGSDGSTVISVRLPAVVNINGLVDMANAGLIKDESLPNIKQYLGRVECPNNNLPQATIESKAENYTFKDEPFIGDSLVHITFNANNTNSVYKDNAPVQQEAIQYPYFIQIATGVETEVNIKDTLELNNPFTFGMNMYFKGEMENISWLKSANQQNPKALCPDFYNWVLANANAGKDGFKLSTASDITDYDFKVNTTDETFRLPLKNGQEGVFANGVIPEGWNLYYYVGETLKNPNLIDAGRIGENLANKLDTPPRYPVEISDKSLMPSWYVVYSDGWCEQGGISKTATTGGATVSLLKPYESTNYTRLLTLGNRLDNSQWAIYPTNKTTTSFGAFSPVTGYELEFDWETKGYIN